MKIQIVSGGLSTRLRVSSKAAREDTRTTNRRLVLQHLFGDAPLSRADLARRTELTPATVSTLVNELQNRGLVAEADMAQELPRVGKPPTMLRIRPDAHAIVALDLSDPERFRSAVVDLGGAVVDRAEIEVGRATGRAALDLVEALVARTITLTESPVLGIGVGTPGVVAPDGAVIEATRFDWHRIAIRAHIEDAVGHPTYVTNDANAAAIAEYTRGGHDGSHLAVIKIGSGVGAGFVLNGHPFEGEQAGAGEVGHLVVDPTGPICRCGHRGCLETFLSTPNIEAAVATAVVEPERVLHAAADRLGVALAAIVAILDLHQVFLSGPRSLLGDDFCEIATASLRDRCLESVAESVHVRYTSLGDDVVLLGAAALVLSQELGVA